MSNAQPAIPLLLAALGLMTGCASGPVPAAWQQKQITLLSNQVQQLGSTVTSREAGLLAHTAVEQAADLAKEYRAVRPAWVGNYLVNMGYRERGLCYDWANGLYPILHKLNLQTLELHLAVARMDTRHEHNCIVVTAVGQPLAQGIVLDAWRHSGWLWSGPVAKDKYPWGPLPDDRIPPELDGLVPRKIKSGQG